MKHLTKISLGELQIEQLFMKSVWINLLYILKFRAALMNFLINNYFIFVFYCEEFLLSCVMIFSGLLLEQR